MPDPTLERSIAVIGMAGRFPGADDIAGFWRNLRAGASASVTLSDTELRAADVPEHVIADPDYVKRRPILSGIDLFDAGFFGFLPREAELLDPQQRLFLECAWHALEDSGHARDCRETGVFAGAAISTYLIRNLLCSAAVRDGTDMSQLVFSNDKDHLATRAGYKLDLRGPCIAVSSACSTSLVAVHMACRILLGYQCDMALAGGAAVVVPQGEGYLYRDGGMASPDGLCRAFDAAARGTVFSSGVGVVALRRYEDSVRDGDHIYAVIRGSAVNNDGAGKVGYTAPAVEGQAAVIAEALAVADVEPGTVSYIEAHGTGTPLGDPIELRALRKAFGDVGGRRGFCALGSVKTNVGHLDAASGVTGLIKVALALHAKELPPSLNFASADPELGLEDSPFRVQTRLEQWPGAATPRRAGVSSFGVGGTNAHVVLEEAPQRPAGAEPTRGVQLLTLSARSETALARMGENLADHLAAVADDGLAAVPDGGARALADIAFSLAVGRRDFDHRRTVLARDPAEAARLLRAPDPAQVFEGRLSEGERAVVFLFPGQGAQRVGMGAGLYRAEPVFRAQIDRCADLLRPLLGLDLRDLLYPAPEQSARAAAALDRTAVTQPALFAVEYALARLWMEAYGIRPSALIGHSLGEYVAACIAGVFSLEDALTLVAERGRLMQALPAGAMVAVALGPDAAAPLLLPGLSIAAVNAPDRCVVSGEPVAVDALLARLAKAGVEAMRLRTSHAFHSAMMDPILNAFRATVGAIRLAAPRIPIVSNLDGGWLADDEAAAPDYWVRHLRQTVNFAAGLRTLSAGPRRLYLEVGPGRTLSRLAAGQGASGAVAAALAPGDADTDEAEHGLATLGRLWSLGAAVDWTAFYQAERRLRVPLPPYPFERRRYWISPDAAASAVSAAPPVPHPAAAVAEAPTDGVGVDGVSADGVRAVLWNAVPAVAEAPADGVPADGARANGVRAVLRKIVAEASGLQEVELDPACSFLDLGFDSLALIQVNQNIRRRLGVDIPFRDLMDRLPSIDSLAAHLDAVLPMAPAALPHGRQDKVAKEVTPPPLEGGGWGEGCVQPWSAAVRTPPPNPLPQGEGEHIVPRSAAYPDAYTVPPAAAPIPATVPAPPASLESLEIGLAPTALDYATVAPARAADALDPRQQRYLADLTARYTARTPASKRAAQEYRPALADARVSLGFRRRWKEMLYPLVVTRAAGAHVWDADGNQYIDLLMGFGVNLFGHWPGFIQQALHAAIEQSPQLVGPQSPLAGPVARRFCEITGNERATFCNTGSEAVMTAIRLARTATGRDRIALFRNSYHGNIDSVIVRPRGAAGAMPAALGIPQHAADDIVVLDYCTEAALDYLDRHGADIAAVLVEPVQCRMPELDPRGFLRDLRRVADRTGTLLVFDEVVTGFRIHAGGAQARFGVQADLATYGKVLGGGMPIGVVAGRAVVMDAVDGGMWAYGDDSFPRANQTAFAGTFCKHPFAVAAAGAVLDHVATQGPRLQQDLGARTDRLVAALQACCDEEHAPIGVQSFASIFKFTPAPDFHHLDLFFYELRSRGISVWEERPYFLSTAHTDADIDGIVQATAESLAALRRGGILSVRPQRVPAGRIPLTSPQREVWAASMLGADASAAYTITAAMQLSGLLDAEALRDAFNRVIARHDALRTVLDPDGTAQRFAPLLSFDLTPEDFSLFPPDQRAALLDARLEHEAQTAFDLAQSPLLRAGLLRLGEREHVLVLAAHHIVCDGISMDIVFRELVALYLDATGGAPARLEPPLRFADYVAWQQGRRAAGATNAARDHWAGLLADGVPVLDLPLAQPRPRVPGTGAQRETLVLDGTALPGLRAAGRRLGATSLVSLMTCFAILLHRLTNQDRLVIGLPVTGRSALDGSGPLVGHCVNLVPVPVEIDGALSFAAILARVREGVLAAQEHWDVTPGELATALRLPRDPGRPLLAAVTFNLETAPAQLNCGGLTLTPVPAPKPFVQFELELNAIDGGSAITLTCDYNAGLFDGATVRRWLGYLREVALGAAALPGTAVGRLPLLTAAERRALLPVAAVPWVAAAPWAAAASGPAPHRGQDKPDAKKNAPPPLVGGGWGEGSGGANLRPPPPPNPLPQGEGEHSSILSAAYPDAYRTAPEATLHRWFERRAAAAPAAVAVTMPGDARAGLSPASLTYGALNARANRLARHLRALGVGPETPVGLCLDRTPDIVVGLLGILKAGGAYLPLDPNFPPERIAFMLSDARAPVVLTTDALRRSLPREGGVDGCVVVSLDGDIAAFDRLPDGDLPGSAMPGNAAYVIYTSGSTGQPKGVVVTHANVARLFTATQDAFAFGASDVWTCVHSYAFDFSVWETWGALLFGGRLVVVPHWIVRDPDALWALIENEHVTVLSQTPSAFRQLVAAADSRAPADLRLVMFGGEALDFRSLDPWFARCGDMRPALVNMYGITETTVHVTCRPLAAPDALLPSSLIGEPLPDLGMAILDRYLEPAPPGVAGEIHVSGAGLARGYLGRPALTAERFVPDPHGPPGGRLYRTGDLARRLPQGDVEFGEVEYLGRLDHQVQLRGYRVETGEIEAALRAEGAREAAVVLRAGDDGHQRLVAYVAMDPAAEAGIEPPILRDGLARRVPDYMVPALFVALPALPKTATGKIDRAALPVPAAGTAPVDRQEPRTAAERVLAAIWAEALGLPAVGINENFFELGGDSIINIQVVARARRAGLRFGPRDLFASPTVAGLAAIAQPVDRDGRANAECGPAAPGADLNASRAPVPSADPDASRTPVPGADPNAGRTPVPTPPEGPIPLLPMQCRFLRGDPVDPDYFTQSVLLEVPANLDADHLRRALDAVVGHHAALRLRFSRDADGRWTQIAGPTAGGAGFAVVDATEAMATEPAATEAAVHAARVAVNLAQGPLVQARLLRTGAPGPRPDRLLIAIHHLVTDGVTWRVLLSDLETTYRQARHGEAIALPPCGTSLAAWAHHLRDRAASSAVAAQLDYWLEPARAEVQKLPVDWPGGPDTVASERRVTVGLPASRTRALLTGGLRRPDATAEEILLAALAIALSRFCGAPDVLVAVEAHGREDDSGEIDLSRTAGWLTALYPLLLHLPAPAAPHIVLRAVREQFRAVPERGLGYGLLRHLSPDPAVRAGLAQAPQAEVLWNYLGQLRREKGADWRFGVVTRPGGFDRSPRAPRTHAIEINALIEGDTLQVEFAYSAARHDRRTIEALAADYLAVLDNLIDNDPAAADTPAGGDTLAGDGSPTGDDTPTSDDTANSATTNAATAHTAGGYAPSDFPDAELSEHDLAMLVAELEREEARTP